MWPSVWIPDKLAEEEGEWRHDSKVWWSSTHNPKLVMESTQAGAERVLGGGKGTKTMGWWEYLRSLEKRQLLWEPGGSLCPAVLLGMRAEPACTRVAVSCQA